MILGLWIGERQGKKGMQNVEKKKGMEGERERIDVMKKKINRTLLPVEIPNTSLLACTVQRRSTRLDLVYFIFS